MFLKVLDKDGVGQTIVVNGQEAVVDNSGTIVATGVPQTAAAASTTRSGFFLQNIGTNDMHFNDLGAATVGAGSVLLKAGERISTLKDYPLTAGAISIIGTIGDKFTLRTW